MFEDPSGSRSDHTFYGKRGWLRKVASSAATNASISAIPKPPYLRLARPEDHRQIIEVGKNALLKDPAFLYFGNVKTDEVIGNWLTDEKETQLRSLMEAFIKATVALKGRITVVVDPSQEKIVAAALWLPPKKRIGLQHLRLFANNGVMGLLRDYQGVNSLLRARNDWLEAAHDVISDTYKKKLVRQGVDDSWYLLSLVVEPKNQNRGFMKLLMDDAFNYAPNETFSLAATTQRSKGLFLQYGFEVLSPFRIGKGKVNGSGLRGTEDRTGVECYAMVKNDLLLSCALLLKNLVYIPHIYYTLIQFLPPPYTTPPKTTTQKTCRPRHRDTNEEAFLTKAKAEILSILSIRETLVLASSTTVQNLPAEVLNRIFFVALKVKEFDHKTQLTRTTLRLVCTQWNDIILSDPRLWTDIFICLFLKDKKAPGFPYPANTE